MPLRLQLTGGTWLDLVRQVFATERDSLAWRRYPLAELQKRLGGQPLFDTAFNFVHFHIYQAIIGVQDLEVLGGKFFNQTNFTLLTNFSLHPLSGEVELTLKYDGDRLGQAQMERMAGYYQKVLTAIAQNPSQSFQDLCLLSDEEQAQILWDWNRTQTDLPPQQCVHQLFEIQVERSPDAVAIVWNQERLTYRQLNEQARSSRPLSAKPGSGIGKFSGNLSGAVFISGGGTSRHFKSRRSLCSPRSPLSDGTTRTDFDRLPSSCVADPTDFTEPPIPLLRRSGGVGQRRG